MGEVLNPVHHGCKPFGAPHAKVDSICDNSLLESISHVLYILFFNVVEVIEAIEACLSADGFSLIWNPKPNPIETLIHNDVWVNHSWHVVNVVSCLWNNREKGMCVSKGCLHQNDETCKPLMMSQHSRQGDQSQQSVSLGQ